jgi:hypothetical protein
MANAGVVTNYGIFLDGYNISGRSNNVNAALTKEIKDRSYYGAAGRIKGTGLESAAFSLIGFHDAAVDIERTYHGVDVLVSLFIPATGGAAVAAGNRAIFFKALEAGYGRGVPFGDDATFGFNAIGDQLGYPIGVGYVLNPGLVAVTADNTPAASILQLGAVAAGQYLYAILHVTEVSTADALVVTIQSDPIEGFTTATPRIVFASKSAIGSEIAVRVPGPITDTWWRAYPDVTITGEPCAIKFAVAMAIR